MEPITLSLPLPRQAAVLLASQAARPAMLDLAARLAVTGPLRVLDGGNHFNAYIVARAARRLTSALHPALENIHLARAFTCYQMHALLQATPTSLTPTLVLDLLATFYDENVPLYESRRLLLDCVEHIQRLAASAPVVISARPPGLDVRERLSLVDTLQTALPVLVQVPAAALPAPHQLPLFA